MLCAAEANALARLVLARQTLICRAMELDKKCDVLALSGPEVYSWEEFHILCAELTLIPGLLQNVELEIAAAQQRFNNP